MIDNGIFHSDLKPENVFIDKNHIAIIGDFGEIINYYFRGKLKDEFSYTYLSRVIKTLEIIQVLQNELKKI